MECFIVNEKSAGSPARAERGILGVVYGVFGTIQALFVVGQPLCDVGVPSQALITLLRDI